MKAILTLASSSPRRRELIALGGWMFHISPVDVNEESLPDETPKEYALRIAISKAKAAVAEARPDGIIVAADTTVADGEQILGKPASPKESAEMLWQLRGRTHKVHTAIAVIRPGEDIPLIDICTSEVPMRKYSDEEIFEYIASGDPYDKAGGYAIQHPGFRPVDNLQGCYANVVGLPLCHLTRTLEKIGVQPRSNVPKACQSHFKYECPIYERILLPRS